MCAWVSVKKTRSLDRTNQARENEEKLAALKKREERQKEEAEKKRKEAELRMRQASVARLEPILVALKSSAAETLGLNFFT
jgi:hypothetical protein